MENQIFCNITSVQHLMKDEIFSFSAEGKVFKVKETVRKRKFYYLKLVENSSKIKLNRKFSFKKAQTVPIYLKTPLKDTQIPQAYITKLTTICNN